MKRLLSLVMAISICLCAIPALADVIYYCPNCKKRISNSYGNIKYCPYCSGKLGTIFADPGSSGWGDSFWGDSYSSGNNTRNDNGSNNSYQSSSSSNLPCFYHSLSGLQDIAKSMYQNPYKWKDKSLSSFPFYFSVDLKKADAITSLNLPNKKYISVPNTYWYEWKYDVKRGRFLKDGEYVSSGVYVTYTYWPVQQDRDFWTNQIDVKFGDGAVVKNLSFSFSKYSSGKFMTASISVSNYPGTSYSFYFNDKEISSMLTY